MICNTKFKNLISMLILNKNSGIRGRAVIAIIPSICNLKIKNYRYLHQEQTQENHLLDMCYPFIEEVKADDTR